MTVLENVRSAAMRLIPASTTPQLDAELLLAKILRRSRLWLVGHGAVIVTKKQRERLKKLVRQRQEGIPMAYLLGSKEFYGRPFLVSRGVLVPRPDSEVIIEKALTLLADRRRPTVLDIGTGSGCLAITLAVERPDVVVTATDRSKRSLSIARRNAAALQVADRLIFKKQDLLLGECGRYDLVVANLPYLPTDWLRPASRRRHHLTGEPAGALNGGPDGLNVLRRFLRQWAARPAASSLILEHGDGQERDLMPLVAKLLPTWRFTTLSDATGRPRALHICPLDKKIPSL